MGDSFKRSEQTNLESFKFYAFTAMQLIITLNLFYPALIKN